MKKLKLPIILLLTMCSALFIMTACQKNKGDAPTDLMVDDNNRLTWTAVANARSYTVNIYSVDTKDTITETTRKTSYSVAELEEGDYVIKVMATSGRSNEIKSDWSKELNFHKDYETGCTYTLINNNSEYEITRANKAKGIVRIEDTYRGKPVTRIGENAFKSCSRVEGVEIGNRVTYIGENAFYSCTQLVFVKIPESVTYIGDAAFQNCGKLVEVNIPDNITEISDYAFAYCESLQSISLSNNVVSIGEAAFANCTGIKEIVIPDSVKVVAKRAFDNCLNATKLTIGNSVESIGERAFYKCSGLGEVKFGTEGKLRTIGVEAFSKCYKESTEEMVATGIKSIKLPEGLESIESKCFANTETLEEISIPDSVRSVGSGCFDATKIYSSCDNGKDVYLVYADKWLVACYGVRNLTALVFRNPANDTELIVRDNTVGIANSVFANATNLSRAQVPYSVRDIGTYSFYNCGNMTRFETGTQVDPLSGSESSRLERVGRYAFMYCNTLSTLRLYNGLERIESYAFYGCSNLKNNTLDPYAIVPETVKFIGTYSFYETALWNAPDDMGVIYVGNWVLGYAGSSSTITLKESAIGIAAYCFYANDRVITIANSSYVRYICEGAFAICSGLSKITLNPSLSEIVKNAFYGCQSLTEIEIGRNVTTIGEHAFYKCVSLTHVDMSRSRITEIGRNAFYGCASLMSVTFSEKTEKIGEYIFYDCRRLREVTIPDALTEIPSRAFSRCQSLAKLDLGNGVKTIGEYAFNSCFNLQEVILPDSVVTVMRNAFYKCNSVNKLVIGANVETIGDYAFYNLAQIKELKFPASLKHIGKYAFKGCNGLESIILLGSIKSIGNSAFYGCKAMTIYTDATQRVDEWSLMFNSSYRPIVWGCQLSDDKSYVVSVTIGESSISNKDRIGDDEEKVIGVRGPARAGYTFLGWSTNANATTAEYKANEIVNVPNGTKLYSVWKEGVEEPEQPVEPENPVED